MTALAKSMNQIQLPYGLSSFDFAWEQDQFSVLTNNSNSAAPLSDFEIGEALDTPISTRPLDELIKSDESILLVVSDATRATASAQVINLLVRRLIQHGVSTGNIAIVFATGIHRPVTAQEKLELLSPFIVERIRTIDHDAYDPAKLVAVGNTESGTVVEIARPLTEFSHVVLTGGVGFHYFAGFTGGRKSICPGLSSAKTIEQTHMLALDFEKGGRRTGVGIGLLDGNAVNEECERVAELVGPTFIVNTIVNELNQAVAIYCGDWRAAHRTACNDYLQSHAIEISERRNLVIVSCGGLPHDINMIQAHKALEMASYACNEGGTIILLAECRDGLGRPDFLKWFSEGNSRALEQRLRGGYEVNGQTAWSLLSKTERYKVHLVSELPVDHVKQMRMTPSRTLSDALEKTDTAEYGFIMPRGAAYLPRQSHKSC
jgi:nickel-dependent lactate racemase